MLQRLFAGETVSNDVPLAPIRHTRKASIATADMTLDSQDDLTERHWYVFVFLPNRRPMEQS
jgi:hypothetical protein